MVYSVVVTRRMRSQNRYKPEFEDWLCYSILPITGYMGLIVFGCTGFSMLRLGSYGIAAAVLLILITGIHNAWDAAVYIALGTPPDSDGVTHDVSGGSG